MDSRIVDLIGRGDRLFASRGTLMSYWQEVAENFYPERADFTTQRNADEDWWAGLMTSEPVLKRRELGNIIQSMLRPDSRDWFAIHTTDEEADKKIINRRWLEYMTTVQRRAMYHPAAQFTKATKQGDHDWVTFGQTVIEVDVRRDEASLVYRAHHLRDVAWTEDEYGEVGTVFHRWKPTARQLVNLFPGQTSKVVQQAAKDEPERRISCYRILIAREEYGGDTKRTPQARWMSVYVDKENETVLAETPRLWNPFVIPRWQTIPGSQYGWSPCTGPGLADARTLQSITRVLLEAGEKAVDPPLIAYEEALRSDISVYAGGITYLDADYDERKGDPIRPITQDRSGFPIGLELANRHSSILYTGFFLDRMQLPQDQGKMTAYEVRKRLEEHIRSSTPLLAPAEDEYNAKLCERTFEVLKAMKAFGPEDDLPADLSGQNIRYEFLSPIREMSDELKSQKLLEALEVLGPVAQFDPAQLKRINLDKAIPDVLRGRGIPADWMTEESAFQKHKAEIERAAQIQQGAQAIDQGAGTVAKVAQAAQIAEQAA